MDDATREQCQKVLDGVVAYIYPKVRRRMLLWGESPETAIAAVIEGKEDGQHDYRESHEFQRL